MQDWIKSTGQRIVVVFEGRDAAGKGGVIKAITERVSPRIFRVVALPAPSDREKSQMYVQRYLTQYPAAGEVVIFGPASNMCSASAPKKSISGFSRSVRSGNSRS